MKTRREQRVVVVTDASHLSEIAGFGGDWYTASRITRTYTEGFIDKGDGQVVSVQREEFILGKGHHLTSDDFSMLMFMFQSGDIKEMVLSDQQREGYVQELPGLGLWNVKAASLSSKLNMLLRAKSAASAYEVAADYIELNYNSKFFISKVTTFDDSVIIEPVEEERFGHVEDEPARFWYSISLMIEEGDGDSKDTHSYSFIVFADTVETAKEIIDKYVSGKYAEKDLHVEYVIKIQEAKVINCNVIVPQQFCVSYFANEKE